MAQIVVICIAAGIFSGLSYAVMEIMASSIFKNTLDHTGGTSQVFATKNNKEVISIKVSQYVRVNDWAAVYAELRDANGNTLFGFEEEFWHETGYDDGHWEEQVTEVLAKATIEEPGQYSVYVESETNARSPYPVVVEVYNESGSSFIFIWISVISFVLAIFFGKTSGLDSTDLTSAFK